MIHVRLATDLDRPNINEVRKAAWRKAYVGLLPDDVIAAGTSNTIPQQPRGNRGGQMISDEIQKSRVGFIAHQDEEILAFVMGGLSREIIIEADCELWAIYVHPNFQRQGFGLRLF